MSSTDSYQWRFTLRPGILTPELGQHYSLECMMVTRHHLSEVIMAD